jgi:excisionase family DNA binding protein
MTDEPKFLHTVDEAARALRVSATHLQRMADERRVPHRRLIGGEVAFTDDHIREIRRGADVRPVPLPQDRPTLSIPEVAAILGCSRANVYRVIKDGHVPSITLSPRRIVVPTVWVREFLGLDEPRENASPDQAAHVLTLMRRLLDDDAVEV